jgi:cytochrome c-type protein NapC
MSDSDRGLFGRIGAFIRCCSPLVLLVGGVTFGVLAWGGFNTAMEASNSTTFCIACHEMRDTVYKEWQESVHFKNASGVQATCADCHVPRSWVHKVVRKVKATNELYHKVAGTVNTPEKFEAKRWELANRVWDNMKATDSRECRNCHDLAAMDLEEQDRSGKKKHAKAREDGKTCIDCHKGLAHEYPSKPKPAEPAVAAR